MLCFLDSVQISIHIHHELLDKKSELYFRDSIRLPTYGFVKVCFDSHCYNPIIMFGIELSSPKVYQAPLNSGVLHIQAYTVMHERSLRKT